MSKRKWWQPAPWYVQLWWNVRIRLIECGILDGELYFWRRGCIECPDNWIDVPAEKMTPYEYTLHKKGQLKVYERRR